LWCLYKDWNLKMALDKSTVIHLIGIGGTGLSAIGRVLMESGYLVTGSDALLSTMAADLRIAGVKVIIGHQAENVGSASLVVRSSAIPDDNIEVLAAKAAGIPVVKRNEFLSEWLVDWQTVAVAGTHGKTTTTAMIAWMLTALGQDPSYIVGGVPANLGVNAHAGQGAAFVIEADEYDHMFLGLHPRIALVTNVEHDHPDCYPTAEDYYQAFVTFTDGIIPEGCLLACGDHPGAARLLSEADSRGKIALAYGMNAEGLAYVAENLSVNPVGGYTFDARCNLSSGFDPLPEIQLQVPGKHNVLNALAALAVAHQFGLSTVQAGVKLASFIGTGRRFEVRGEVEGVVVIDDYAHHPTEIRATLEAARMRYPGRRLWVVWQPHTYSRTRTLLHEFATSFELADEVLVTEIYPAREEAPADHFSAQQVVMEMHHSNALFIPDLTTATSFLLNRLSKGAVLLVMSAGDADQISTQVLTALRERSITNA
jgi:UDP-N-acetylmuramate--alanine ligase